MTIGQAWNTLDEQEFAAWKDGDTAAVEGMRVDDNPHPIASKLYRAWDLGLRGFPVKDGRRR